MQFLIHPYSKMMAKVQGVNNEGTRDFKQLSEPL
jgi:hypothetical protein